MWAEFCRGSSRDDANCSNQVPTLHHGNVGRQCFRKIGYKSVELIVGKVEYKRRDGCQSALSDNSSSRIVLDDGHDGCLEGNEL